MPKAENDQGEVESTTGTEPTAKTEPTKVVDLTAEKAPTPNEDGAAEQTNGVSTSLKRKSTGDGPEEGAQAEKAQRLSAEEVGEEKVSDPEGSSDAPVAQPDGAEAAEFEKVPPWVHSDVHPSEIGWRMGELEQYKFDFWDWFMTLSDAEQQRFKDKYPPPEEWADFYENESENEDDDVEGEEAEADGAQ